MSQGNFGPTFCEGLSLIRWPFSRQYPGHTNGLREKTKMVFKDRVSGELVEKMEYDDSVPIKEYQQVKVDKIVSTVLKVLACLIIIAALMVGGYYLGKYINNNKE